MSGWISIHRAISDNWVWDCEFSTGQAWVDLLLHANHKENKFMIKGQMVTVKRGEQARSEVTLAKQWKWSRNKVRRFLKNLENDSMIERKTTHLTTIISICNYSSFQVGDTTGDTAKGQQTKHVKDSRRNTNNNVNNVNKENKEIIEAKASRSKKFIKPTIDEVYDYMKERNHNSRDEAERFVDYWESIGWVRNKTPMKDWKASVRTWLKNSKPLQESSNGKPSWARGML
ncbi:coil containing protein [Vibrio phage 1.064.O._10N.261.52.E2]|nr:coil containing protein [Vibrio phage 1.064.O._10N.261.52.E2]AUR88111.1 coil containing protein [Vibrio phage 1.108.O._10N.222.51.A4]AUR97485.1 coil containing protein [Vibrio phage 1.239.O._10N.261.52.F6]AUR97603.1 coil containing protein [Vibrio phage 1.242.O._10N.261.54.B2]